MKFTRTGVPQGKMILANDHYTAIPYDCTLLTALATNGVIKEGTLIPSNDGNAIGVLLNDVVLAENPNGTVVIHGFIKMTALPASPTQAAINTLIGKGVQFIDAYSKPQIQKYALTYDLNGATGTEVVDANSPYVYGATATLSTAPTITTYPEGTTQFDKWNTKADGTGTAYAASATLTITDNVKLYATYKA